MANYYAHITGAANVQVPFSPYQVYTGNGNYVKLEVNCDNLRTDSVRNNAAVWLNGTSNWFSFEMYGEGWEYFNLGSTTYIGRYNYWSTSGFEETLVLEVNNRAVTLTKGQQTSATTFSGNFTSSNISFFPTTYATNTRVNFYEWKAYGANNTLLCDFVPNYSGTTNGLLDKVSGNFYAATDQSKMTLYSLKTFEISRTEVTAVYMPATYILALTADDDMTWTASTDSNWITLLDATGTGSHTFRLQFSKNEAHSVRNGIVTIVNNYGDEIEIYVTQEKYPLFVPSENIYRADLEVVKGYRSGSTINKAYRSGELIYYKLNYSEPTPPTPQEQPLTFKITSSGDIVWKANNASYTKTIQFSKNNGSTWTSITSNTGFTAPSIPVNAGDVVQFKGDNAQYASSTTRYNTFNGSTAKFEVEGNIMSLIDSTGFTTATTLARAYTFANLFYQCTGLTSAENLILPATTLADYCYRSLFDRCTSLTTAPSLPATTLGLQVYRSMFYNCTSLTTAPELPATALKSYCYYNMFWGCSSLNYIKCLATDISASNCTTDWVNGVASSGTFVKNLNMTGWTRGSDGIPLFWTVRDA